MGELIRDGDSLRSLLENQRVVCVASTPFQLLCLLSIFGNFELRCEKKILIISGHADSAAQMAERVRDVSLFEKVICARFEYPQYKHLGFAYAYETLFKKRISLQRFRDAVGSENDDKFDVLFCSCADRLTLDVKKYLVPEGCTVFYDEGSGTHSGLCFRVLPCFDEKVLRISSSGASLKNHFRRLIKGALLKILPRESHFNIQNICLVAPREDELRRMPPVDVTPVDMKLNNAELVRVFGISEAERDLYKNKKIIYLSMPFDAPDDALRCEREILELLSVELGSSLGIRLHPRRSESDFGVRYSILPSCNWEVLVGSGAIDDEHLLIGTCSSAQTNCKSFFGIEPSLIFLQKMIPVADRPAIEQIIDDIEMLYTDRSRVMSPDSREDLIRLVRKFVVQT